MKTLTLIMAVLLAIATTAFIIIFPIVVEFNGNSLGLLCIISAVGYLASYAYFDSYTEHVKKEAYMAGYDAGATDQYI